MRRLRSHHSASVPTTSTSSSARMRNRSSESATGGSGGIQIAVGKLAVYTAAAGIDPGRVIPVSLDVGTDNETLLNDPLYVGLRRCRVRGRRTTTSSGTASRSRRPRSPNVLIHFEDFGPDNARRLLVKYGDTHRVFNDDMQGTGAIALAALFSALEVTGQSMPDQRVLIFGAGTAGVGIADQVRDAMIRDGANVQDRRAGSGWSTSRDS